MRQSAAPSALQLRAPRPEDASAIWELVRDSSSLETNSPYAYLLLCTDFADTSLVLEEGGELIGFELGYRPPRDPECVFVWQIGVAERARGRGLASRMLDALFARQQFAGARYLQATVAPSNSASRALFLSFAARHDAACSELLAFPAGLFPAVHEDEVAMRIGPIAAPTHLEGMVQ